MTERTVENTTGHLHADKIIPGSIPTEMLNVTLVDPRRQPAPDPCPDCGRAYLNGESIAINVPTPEGGYRTPWKGCIDCWLLRTMPNHPEVGRG